MKVIAVLYDPATGRRVEYVDDYDFSDADAAEFFWVEHNFGCDCNRRDVMCDVLGLDRPEMSSCGDTIRLLELRDQATGEVILGEALE